MNESELNAAATEMLAMLDEASDAWFAKSGLDEAVMNISTMVSGPFKERTFDLIVRMVKQAYVEGAHLVISESLGRKGSAI